MKYRIMFVKEYEGGVAVGYPTDGVPGYPTVTGAELVEQKEPPAGGNERWGTETWEYEVDPDGQGRFEDALGTDGNVAWIELLEGSHGQE